MDWPQLRTTDAFVLRQTGLRRRQRLSSNARKLLIRSATACGYCAMNPWPERGNCASQEPGIAFTSFSALDGGITTSSVPLAMSTGRRICRNRFAMLLRCHASMAAAWRCKSSGDNWARRAAMISPKTRQNDSAMRLGKSSDSKRRACSCGVPVVSISCDHTADEARSASVPPESVDTKSACEHGPGSPPRASEQ